MDFKTLPKVELHRHLEGSIRLETAFELVTNTVIALPARSIDELRSCLQVLQPMENLERVLRVFDFIAQLFTSESLIERLTYEVVSDAAKDGIRLLELRFSPGYMARPATLSWDKLMECLLRGIDRAITEHDIEVGLIVIASRHLGLPSAVETMDFAKRWKTSLVGFDLADDEISWPSRNFKDVLAGIHELGLGLTVHSGESGGPEYVCDTLHSLAPKRIGHGITIARDSRLVEQVRNAGVLVEVCPTSNLRTRCVPVLSEHPARQLWDAGVSLSFNTDDPGLFDVTLSGELMVAHQQMGFSIQDIHKTMHLALCASFVSQKTKSDLLARYPLLRRD